MMHGLTDFDTPVYLSIDGGTSTAGLTFFTVKDGKMVIRSNYLVDTSNTDRSYDYLVERHGRLTARLQRMKDALNYILDNEGVFPQLFIYESHFFNPRRPNAAIPLVRFMHIVEEICIDRGIYMEVVSPQQMKKAIGVKGKLKDANKNHVLDALCDIVTEGVIIPHEDPATLSEHEVDSIGIGYTYITQNNLL